MFLNHLIIRDNTKIIRKIPFTKGLNLIVDTSASEVTGNNIGKTTVLKLIDFCLGADKKIIWEDPENKKEEYSLVKNFLIDNEIIVELSLVDNLDNPQKEVIIERNFISRGKKVIRDINDKFYTDDEYDNALKENILSKDIPNKPSFRQISSHNIRYKELSLTQTMKTLDKMTNDAEYETLYLFLFGCSFSEGESKQKLLDSLRLEDSFKRRLEKSQTKTAYEASLSIVESEIEVLNKKKSSLNINENFENDLNILNAIKFEINNVTSDITKLELRKELIIETQNELKKNTSNIDVAQLSQIYSQATSILGKMQKTFEDLVNYHNKMINEKSKYVTKELPSLEEKIERASSNLRELLKQEEHFSTIISKSNTFEELEVIINQLNEKHRLKGEYQNTIQQLDDVEKNIKKYNDSLNKINKNIFSEEFENTIKAQLKKFNAFFSSVSDSLYKEKYAVKYDKEKYKNGSDIYKFSAFNLNFSSGKKQGEISCFDIAYILFADQEKMPCLHFILNDKKELMHDNQLVAIADYVKDKNVQFVASILKDKLPTKLNDKKYFCLELHDKDKLFRVEN